MAHGQTQTASGAGNSVADQRRRARRPSHRLELAAALAVSLGLGIVLALALRAVVVAAVGVLAVAAAVFSVLVFSRPGRYADRNLPPGGILFFGALLALLAGGLLEAAGAEEGRPILLVLLGAGGLLAGGLADGLLSTKFRARIEYRGLPEAQPSRRFDPAGDGFRQLVGWATAFAVGMLGAIPLSVLVGESVSASTDSVTSWLAALFLAGGVAVGGAKLVTLVAAGRGSAQVRRRLTAAVADLRPEILVHFSGGIATRYQLAHWLPAISATRRPWLLLYREAATYRAAAGDDVAPAVLIEDFGDLDLVVADSVGAVLYVNTATKNNHLVRFEDPVHVQLHHGESDKLPSSGKTMRLYDAHFVAGSTARARLETIGIASDRIFEVGRPVTDTLAAAGDLPQSILYAPTWEGAHADSDLSSLDKMGEAIVRAMAATGREFVFRPHPLTGTADTAAAAARRRVADLVRSLGGIVDEGSRELVTAFVDAGLLICDVSSVLVDWYAIDRPVLVTDVAGIGEDQLRRRYPTTTGATAIKPPLDVLQTLIEESLRSDPMRASRNTAAAHMLGEVGEAQERFEAALDMIIRSG